MSKVAVCIATCERPEGLKRLLESLDHLRFPKSGETEISIVVVDNDSMGSARETVEIFKNKSPWPVTYDVEPRRGIPFARNKTVDLAGEIDFISFIDDDETADPLWIDELLAAGREYGAGIVGGPVIPDYDDTIPRWVIKSRAFRERKFNSGDQPPWIGTGNVLIEYGLLQKLKGPFDISFALTGGSDVQLYYRLKELGAKGVWANDAKAFTYIPKSRATTGWIMKRGYRAGICKVMIDRGLTGNGMPLLKRMILGAGLLTAGFISFFPSLLLGRSAAIWPLAVASHGYGMLAGITGARYDEYEKIHGN